MRKALKRPFSCDTCGERFTQPQGVTRHNREKHNPSLLCMYCDDEWSRPYQYRDHLKKHHPEVDCDHVLGKPAGCRRKSTIIGRDFPATRPDRRSQAKLRQRLMTPPLHFPSPAMSPVVYDPQPEYAEPAITTHQREDAQGFEYLGATYATSTLSPTEEGSQSVKYSHPFPVQLADYYAIGTSTFAASTMTPAGSGLFPVGDIGAYQT
jgi:hypothetical protein